MRTEPARTILKDSRPAAGAILTDSRSEKRLSTWIAAALVLATTATFGCAHRGVTLEGLVFEGGALEGEIRNQSGRALDEVLVQVRFQDAAGKTLLKKSFKAVPGGDGAPLPHGAAKHFKYSGEVPGWPADGRVEGRIQRAVWSR